MFFKSSKYNKKIFIWNIILNKLFYFCGEKSFIVKTINLIFSNKLDKDFFKLFIKAPSKLYIIDKVLPCAFISLFISSIYSGSTSNEFATIWAASFVGNVKLISL